MKPSESLAQQVIQDASGGQMVYRGDESQGTTRRNGLHEVNRCPAIG